MDTQPLDHSFHSTDVPNLPSDLHTPQDLLSDPAIGVHHDPFDPASIGVYEPNHFQNGFDSHNLADYQPHNANSFLDHQYSQVDHTSHLDHSFQKQQLADYQSYDSNSLLNHQYSQVDHTSHLDHSFQNQQLADYQSYDSNSLLNHQYSQVDHSFHVEHSCPRSGSEKASELLSQANELEKKANTSKDSSEYNTKNANWHRDHNNPSNAATYDENARIDMAKSEQYQAEAQKLREQAKKV
jgi:hypothetical protein